MKDNKLANKIKEEITKMAKSYNSGHNSNNEAEIEYDDIELMIDGQKKRCSIIVNVTFSFDWWREDDTYWEPGDSGIDDLDYGINWIGIECKDGTIYTEEQENKILEDNYKYLEDYIESDVEEKAYEAEWEY